MAYDEKTKHECVKSYVITGSMTMVNALTKIPLPTLWLWKKQDWWKEYEDNLRVEDSIELSSRLKRIMVKTLDVVEDRLEHGDYVYDQKTGAMRRKPVAMRDAHKVFADSAVQAKQFLEDATPKQSLEHMGDKLVLLAEKFAALAGKKKIEANTIEGDVIEVVPNERVPIEVVSDDRNVGSDEILQEEGNSPSGR